MIYRSKSFSSPRLRKKIRNKRGRKAAGYFYNEKELLRLLAIGLLFTPVGSSCLYWLLVSVAGILFGVAPVLGSFFHTFDMPPRESPIVACVEQKDDSRVEAVIPQLTADFPNWTNLVTEQAEQNTEAVAQNIEQQLSPEYGAYNDTYQGLSVFWADDIISCFFGNIGQLLGKWISQGLSDWRVIFALAAWFAIDTSLRSRVRLPPIQWKLKISSAKSHANMVLSYRRTAWHDWNIRSWWA